MKVEIRAARPTDAATIMAVLRERERKGFDALGPEARTFLRSAIIHSYESWTGLIDDEIVCIWGIERGSLLSDSAFIWLNTSQAVDAHPFLFVRHSQLRVTELRQRYHYIHGYVQADNSISVKWLRWLGFELGDVFVLNGYPVRKFAMVS